MHGSCGDIVNARELINKVLINSGHELERTMPAVLRHNARLILDFDFLVQHEIFRNGGNFNFVQIGANDGVSESDDLIRYVRQYKTRGIMVEPQPDLFAKLTENFSAYPDIQLVNKAIHASETSMPFYSIDSSYIEHLENVPQWARVNGIASFDKEHVLKHLVRIGLTEEAIKQQAVPCITLNELLSLSTAVPDVLKVDVEGYDYQLLSMLDLEAYCPRIILFEHLHMNTDDYEALILKLSTVGYRFLADKKDTTAYFVQMTPGKL